MAVKPIPDGYRNVTPHLTVPGVAKLLDFLQKAFDAREIYRMQGPGNTIMHAEVMIGDSRIMMGEPMGDYPAMPANLYLYVPDADATYKRALSAGATSIREPADQFYGDRSAGVKDPCGNFWGIATHKEDLTPAEVERRAREMMEKSHGAA